MKNIYYPKSEGSSTFAFVGDIRILIIGITLIIVVAFIVYKIHKKRRGGK